MYACRGVLHCILWVSFREFSVRYFKKYLESFTNGLNTMNCRHTHKPATTHKYICLSIRRGWGRRGERKRYP